jgi:hypothetical protein
MIWSDRTPFETTARGLRVGKTALEVYGTSKRSVTIQDRTVAEKNGADYDHRDYGKLFASFRYGDETQISREIFAVSLNPVLPMLVGVLGWQRYLRGEYDLSRLNMEPAVDLNADFEEGHAGLARAAARLGDEATVTKAIEAGLNRRSVLRGDLLAEQSSAFAILGDKRRARRLALEASRHEALPVNLALAWASVSDARKALECLERESFLVYWAPQAVWWDPRFDQIRDERAPLSTGLRRLVVRMAVTRQHTTCKGTQLSPFISVIHITGGPWRLPAHRSRVAPPMIALVRHHARALRSRSSFTGVRPGSRATSAPSSRDRALPLRPQSSKATDCITFGARPQATGRSQHAGAPYDARLRGRFGARKPRFGGIITPSYTRREKGGGSTAHHGFRRLAGHLYVVRDV